LATTMYKQSGNIKTAICSAKNPGSVSNSDKDSPGNAGDRCVMLVSITDGSWVNLKSVDFATGAAKFVVRAASAAAGGSIEIRTGSNTGALAGTCAIEATGGLTTWKDIECDLSSPITGVKDYLYLVFKGSANFRISKYIFKTGSTTPSSSSVAPSSSSAAPPPSSSSAAVSSSSKASSSSAVASSSSRASSSSSGTTPIVNLSPLTTSHSPSYYTLKGEPLGNAKPQKAGVYIVKEGYSVKKIAVR